MEKRLSERIATEILEMITLKHQFSPGDKLPNENDFCMALGVSRTTLRAAIQSLVDQNILEVKRGRGTFVSEQMGNRTLNLLTGISYSEMRIKDLYEVRLIIEPYSAYYAVQRASNEEIQKIKEYERIIEEKLELGEDCVEVNRLFHNAIAAATHNALISNLISTISGEIVGKFQDFGVEQKVHKHTVSDHRMLMEYFQDGDADGARMAMQLHILHSINDYGKIDE